MAPVSTDTTPTSASSQGLPCLATRAAQHPSKAKSKSGAQKRREAKDRAKQAAHAEGADEEYDPTADPEHDGYKFKGKAVLLTWQLQETRSSTSGTMQSADVHAIKVYLGLVSDENGTRRKPTVAFRDINTWSICVERGSHLHAHAYIEYKKVTEVAKRDWFLVPGATGVNIKPNTARGSGYQTAVNRGHFYVYCPFKTTHVESATNHYPGHDYAVKLEWVKDWFQQGKIHNAHLCAREYRCATPAFEAQYKLWKDRAGGEQRAAFIKEREARLKAKRKVFKTFPIVEDWKRQMTEEKDRYFPIVVYGQSLYGKTRMMESQFRNPYITEEWNFDDYDPMEHDAIIFDDCRGIWKNVLTKKVFFQSTKVTKQQTSECNQYTKYVDTVAKPIVICCNPEEDPIPTSSWVQKNMYMLEITDYTWVQDADAPIPLDTVPDGQPRLEHADPRPPPHKRARPMSPPPGLLGPWGFTNTATM